MSDPQYPGWPGQPYGQQPGGYPPPYGYPQYPGPPGYPGPKPPGTNGMAIGSLVCSIAGALLCGISAIAGVILGHLALVHIGQTGQDGRGLALAGVIAGYAAIAMWAVLFLLAGLG